MKRAEEESDVEVLAEKLKWLRLPGMARVIKDLLARADSENLTIASVVSRLCDEEKDSRIRSSVDRRIKDARFPEVNTIDAFDFDFDPARRKLRARYLAAHAHRSPRRRHPWLIGARASSLRARRSPRHR